MTIDSHINVLKTILPTALSNIFLYESLILYRITEQYDTLKHSSLKKLLLPNTACWIFWPCDWMVGICIRITVLAKIVLFCFEFHWSLFIWMRFAMRWHRFVERLVTEQQANHCLRDCTADVWKWIIWMELWMEIFSVLWLNLNYESNSGPWANNDFIHSRTNGASSWCL